MKSVSWRKFGRFYIWIMLLILAVIAFILLRSPAAGQRQDTREPSGLSVTSPPVKAKALAHRASTPGQIKKSDRDQSGSGSNSRSQNLPVNQPDNNGHPAVVISPTPPPPSVAPNPPKDDYVKPLPIIIPDPPPKIPECPMYYPTSQDFFSQPGCPPCSPWPPVNASVNIVCLDGANPAGT